MKPIFNKFLPHIIAIALFFALTLIYMSPMLEGKKVNQLDIRKVYGMQKEAKDYRMQTGDEALWTNSMFGGMPTYHISTHYSKNLARQITVQFRDYVLPFNADMIFFYFLGFYILLLVLIGNPWLSIVGAIAFTFGSYNFIIIEAGHSSKAYAIGFMAPILAGVILTLRGRFIYGGLLTAFALAMQIGANHLQITYYFLFILAFWLLYAYIKLIKEKNFKQIISASLVLLAALIVAIGINFGTIWTTYSYAKHTMRGPSELTFDKDKKTSGLDKDYATNWSYGIAESFSLMIPNIKGGATGAIGNNKKALENVETTYKNEVARQNHYWGDQPFTSGPVYAGAIVIFLMILGMFFIKSQVKWYMLIVIILSLLLAWGKNLMWFTEFFLDYFPLYNKFRAVSMTLVIASTVIPILAFMGVKSIIDKKEWTKKDLIPIYYAFSITGGLALIFWLVPTVFFSFFSQMELNSLQGQMKDSPALATQIDLFMRQIEIARISIFKADALRSFIFILLAFSTILLFIFKKINKNVLIALLGLFILIDMWSVSKRYLNDESFVPARQIDIPYTATHADKQILADNDLHFRVFNPDINPFNDASTSYFHRSIGGYHGAKLKRYQEIIDFHLGGSGSFNMQVINMLNTKYIIRHRENSEPVALLNPDALGNAWFVNNYKIVANADEEILALKDFDATETAIIDKRFENFVQDISGSKDSLAYIKLTDYAPNKLTYKVNTNQKQLAVFSEIYYPDGWQAYINGMPAEHFRVNYILRAMVVPEGNYELVFAFEPKSYYLGQTISLIFSILFVVLCLSVFIFKTVITKRNKIHLKA